MVPSFHMKMPHLKLELKIGYCSIPNFTWKDKIIT